MTELFRISVVFVLILFLLRKKLNIGYVMLIASLTICLIYKMNLSVFASAIKNSALNSITVKLLLSLSLIRVFELILRENNFLDSMMATSRLLFNSKRAIIISMPLLIGMLPSLGGAYFSAPMVKEATAGIHMSQEEKAFINYWFRHPWEYVLPLYPGILLAAAVSNIPLNSLIKTNIAYAVMLLATGFLFAMKGIKKDRRKSTSGNMQKKPYGNIKMLSSFLPIIAVLLMSVFFRIELHYALLSTIIPLIILFRYRPAGILRIIRYGFSPDVVVMILGVMLFKETMEASGAVNNLSSFFLQQKIPLLSVLCILPFTVGMLTGLTVGFVSSTFPLLISMGGGASEAQISLAFSAGFIGVLLSPVHLCLVLTKEYFKADMWGIYKKMLPASALIFIISILEYSLLR